MNNNTGVLKMLRIKLFDPQFSQLTVAEFSVFRDRFHNMAKIVQTEPPMRLAF